MAGIDLAVQSVTDPPTSVVSNNPFSVMETDINNGTDPAGAYRTYFYASLNGTNIAPGTDFLGYRDVGGLASGATSTATVQLTVPKNTPQGTYYVLACADQTKQVTESNETNNCKASTGTFTYSAPDLTEGMVSVTPTTTGQNSTFTITETVTNGAMATANTSTTRFVLSTTASMTGFIGWIRACFIGGAIPQRVIPTLAGGQSSMGSTQFQCYHNKNTNSYGAIPPGTWYVLACADDLNQVSEISETNNCTPSNSFKVTAQRCGNAVIEAPEQCDDGNTTSGDGCSATCQTEAPPDLVVSTLTNPPTTTSISGTFDVTDTTFNMGVSSSRTSTTKYFLSLDTTKSVEDKEMGGSHAVPALAPNTGNMATVTVTVPAVAAGSYYVIACADATSVVTESSETNNCRASTTKTTISGADLTESGVSNPPTSATVGSSFPIMETVTNSGGGNAGASTTWFYLSLNGTTVAAPGAQLATRSVGALMPGQSSTATTQVQIKSGTPAGTYYILACADRGFTVPETNENNNCAASTGTVTVGGTDMITGNVSFTPSTVPVGGTIMITDTTSNPSTVATGQTTTTRFYAATDTDHYGTPDSMLLRYCTTGLDVQHTVPSLAPGDANTQTISAPLCVRTNINDPATLTPIPAGSYFILACADDGHRVSETNERNNCSAAPSQLVIQ